ncbi:hypothetical protein OAH03_04240 [Akkermansiaceae bacterium]|nr:hypothetical protein [Akkermansiaceae bacterium]
MVEVPGSRPNPEAHVACAVSDVGKRALQASLEIVVAVTPGTQGEGVRRQYGVVPAQDLNEDRIAGTGCLTRLRVDGRAVVEGHLVTGSRDVRGNPHGLRDHVVLPEHGGPVRRVRLPAEIGEIDRMHRASTRV